jgi:hypothetical protein
MVTSTEVVFDVNRTVVPAISRASLFGFVVGGCGGVGCVSDAAGWPDDASFVPSEPHAVAARVANRPTVKAAVFSTGRAAKRHLVARFVALAPGPFMTG